MSKIDMAKKLAEQTEESNRTPKKKRQPNPKIKMKNFVRAMGASWYPKKED